MLGLYKHVRGAFGSSPYSANVSERCGQQHSQEDQEN